MVKFSVYLNRHVFVMSLHMLTPAYEEIPAKVLRAPRKICGKGAGSQLQVFTIEFTGTFL